MDERSRKMSDYIKREDAIEMVLEPLSNMPADDVVEVIRCKDCRHHEKFCFDDSKLLCWGHDTDIVVSPTDYCSYGERKEQENE